jgi:O-antigen/teichoic acid export membrane protein
VASHLKKLGGEALVYGLGQVSGRAVQFLLVPILTRALAPDAYAISELVVAYSQTLVLVLVLGMDGALARFFYQEPDRDARIRMVSTSFGLRVVLSIAAALVLVMLVPRLSEPLTGSGAYAKYLAIGAVTLPFTLTMLFANDVLRVTFQPWKFIALNVAQTILTTSLALWWVLGLHVGVIGVLYARLAADAACSLLGLVLIRRTLKWRFSRDALKRMLAYGLPIVPGALAFGVLMGADRYALQRTRSLEEVAVYAVGIKFFAVMSMVISAFHLAYGPFAFALANKPEASRVYSRVMSLFVAAASTAALGLALFAGDVLLWAVPAAYRPAAALVPWLAFAAAAHGLYSVASIGVSLSLKTHLLIWTTSIAALAACGAHAFMTPRWGPPGAAAATFIGYATSAVLTYGVAQRAHPLPYRAGLTGALFVTGLLLALFVPVATSVIALKLLVVAVYATIAAVTCGTVGHSAARLED